MAIIKHLKRLDDTVRGASNTMVAAFDKDGNIIAGKRPVLNIPPVPTNANVGKVWTATGANTAAWVDVPTELPEGESGDEGKILFLNDQLDPQWAPQYPANGSEGDVLTLGETGPEWATPGGGGSDYHSIYIEINHNSVKASAILTVPSSVSDVTSLCSWLNTLYPPNQPAWRICMSSNCGDGKTVSVFLYPDNNATMKVYYMQLSIDFGNSSFTITNFNFSFTSSNGCTITVIP